MRTKRNAVARDLRTPKYRKRVVQPKKGKGSYTRNRRLEPRDGDFFYGLGSYRQTNNRRHGTGGRQTPSSGKEGIMKR